VLPPGHRRPTRRWELPPIQLHRPLPLAHRPHQHLHDRGVATTRWIRPVPLPRLRPGPASRRPAGIDGPGRGLRRQRRHGVLLQPAPKNVLNRRRWTTHDQLRLAIVTWIERTYHRRRRQDALGRLTPYEFET